MPSDDDRPEQVESADPALETETLEDELADQLALEEAVDAAEDSGQPAPTGPRHARARSRRRRGDGKGSDEGEGGDSTKRPRKKAPWWELPALAAIAIVVAVLVKSFLVQPFYIPSQSMEKTLHGCPGCSGDRILVSKVIYDFRDPHPGDIVVFNAPPGWNDEPASRPPSNPVVRVVRGFGQLIGFVPPDGLVLVKRVIAVGGQTVKGDSAGNVYVSDDGPTGTFHKLTEPFVYEDGPDSHAQFGPVTVPKGRLWVMGDHRNDSADSRFHCDLAGSGSDTGANCNSKASTVPVKDVIGKAVIIAWPPSRWRTLGTPSTFKHEAVSAADGALPVSASAAATVPLLFLRRRRRRGKRVERRGSRRARGA